MKSRDPEGIGFISSSATVIKQWQSLPSDRDTMTIPIHAMDKLTNTQMQTLIALFRAKKRSGHTTIVFQPQQEYYLYAPTASKVTLTKPVVMHKRAHNNYNIYIVEGDVKVTEFGRTYQVAGQLIKDHGEIKYKPTTTKTIVTEYFDFNPEKFPTEQSGNIAELLQLIDTKQRRKFFEAGNHHFEFDSDNEKHHIYFKNKNPILIREREHHQGENRFEFLLKKLGGGGFGEVYEALTLAYGLHGELLCKRNDRVVKTGKENLFLAYEEHAKAKRIFARGSKTPIEVETKEGWRTMRVEHRLEKSDMIDYINDEPFDTDETLWFTRNMIVNLIEIHASGFRHKDISPENIMLDAKAKPHPQAQILDFGLSEWHTRKDTISYGKVAYMSTEMLHGHGTTTLSDIYSLGLSIGVLWGGDDEWDSSKSSDTLKPMMQAKSLNFKFDDLFSCAHNLSDWHKKVLEEMIYSMLNPHPPARISLQAALALVEKIILQRQGATLNSDERINRFNSYESTVKARDALSKFIIEKTLDNIDSHIEPEFEKYCKRILREHLTKDTHIQTFVDFVNVRIFANCSTRKEILDTCENVFDDYRNLYKELHHIQECLKLLKQTIQKSHQDDKHLQSIMTIRQSIGSCLERKAEMPLSLDYLAEFNRKWKRDLAEAELHMQELESQIDKSLNFKPKF